MKIVGKSGDEYDVRWGEYGFSFARPNVYVTVRYNILGLFSIRRRKRVWNQNPRRGRFVTVPYVEAKSMHPRDMREWFQQVVDEYEDYQLAWSKA